MLLGIAAFCRPAAAGTLVVPAAPARPDPVLGEVVWPVLAAAAPAGPWTQVVVRGVAPTGDTPPPLEALQADGLLWAWLDGDDVVVRLVRAGDPRPLDSRLPIPPELRVEPMPPGAAEALADAVSLRVEFLLAAPLARRAPPVQSPPAWLEGPPPLPPERLADLRLPAFAPPPAPPAEDIPEPPDPLPPAAPADGPARLDVADTGAPGVHATAPPGDELPTLRAWAGATGLAEPSRSAAGFEIGAAWRLHGVWGARVDLSAFALDELHRDDRTLVPTTLLATAAAERQMRRGDLRGCLYGGLEYGYLRVDVASAPEADDAAAPLRVPQAHRAGAVLGASGGWRFAGPFEIVARLTAHASPWRLRATWDGAELAAHGPVQVIAGLGVGWALVD